MAQFFISSLALTFVLGFPQKHSSEITLCKLEVPPSIMQASTNFSITYAFEIADDRPRDIKKVTNRHVADESVVSCIEKWKFEGFPQGTKLAALFRWEHGKGWVETSVIGTHFSQIVRVTDGLGYKTKGPIKSRPRN